MTPPSLEQSSSKPHRICPDYPSIRFHVPEAFQGADSWGLTDHDARLQTEALVALHRRHAINGVNTHPTHCQHEECEAFTEIQPKVEK